MHLYPEIHRSKHLENFIFQQWKTEKKLTYMKLWDLQHHFQNWFLWNFERTAKLHVQNPCFLIIIMNSNRSPKIKNKDQIRSNLSVLCFFGGVFLLFKLILSVSSTVPQSRASVREDAARFPAAGQRRWTRTSICPWERRGGVDGVGPQRITAPIAAPCPSQIWQRHSGTFPITHFSHRTAG